MYGVNSSHDRPNQSQWQHRRNLCAAMKCRETERLSRPIVIPEKKNNLVLEEHIAINAIKWQCISHSLPYPTIVIRSGKITLVYKHGSYDELDSGALDYCLSEDKDCKINPPSPTIILQLVKVSRSPIIECSETIFLDSCEQFLLKCHHAKIISDIRVVSPKHCIVFEEYPVTINILDYPRKVIPNLVLKGDLSCNNEEDSNDDLLYDCAHDGFSNDDTECDFYCGSVPDYSLYKNQKNVDVLLLNIYSDTPVYCAQSSFDDISLDVRSQAIVEINMDNFISRTIELQTCAMFGVEASPQIRFVSMMNDMINDPNKTCEDDKAYKIAVKHVSKLNYNSDHSGGVSFGMGPLVNSEWKGISRYHFFLTADCYGKSLSAEKLRRNGLLLYEDSDLISALIGKKKNYCDFDLWSDQMAHRFVYTVAYVIAVGGAVIWTLANFRWFSIRYRWLSLYCSVVLDIRKECCCYGLTGVQYRMKKNHDAELIRTMLSEGSVRVRFSDMVDSLCSNDFESAYSVWLRNNCWWNDNF